jgi:hypothetical protein
MTPSLPEQPSELAYMHLYSEVLQDELYLVNRALSLPRCHLTGYPNSPPSRPLLLGLSAI